MTTNLPKLVTAALLALVAPALRAQEPLLLSLDTSRVGGPHTLAVTASRVPDGALAFLVVGHDQLAYFTTPEIPLYVEPALVLAFGTGRTLTLPRELLAPEAQASFLQALAYDGASTTSPWSRSNTWRLEQGRADVLGVDPQLSTWLVSTDSIPPHWTLMASADVPSGPRILRLAGVERDAGTTRVYLRLAADASDATQTDPGLGIPLGTAPGVEVAVYYAVDDGPFFQVALLPTR
jgi:hypothetical protein